MSSAILIFITFLIVEKSTIFCLAKNNVTFDCFPSERNALLMFKGSLLHPSNMLPSWKTDNCCTWQGVECDKVTGHIIGLHLRDTELSGNMIDPSLLELKYLSYLDLSLNDFYGSSIPTFFGSMKQLQHLNLSNANFAGIVPRQLGNLSSLLTLDLGDSIQRSGNLVVDGLMWTTNLSSLEYLDMSNVNLSGTNDLDKVLIMLPSIIELRVSKSGLDNTNLAHTCANSTLLANAQHLDLSHNSFEGHFPCFLHNMTSLISLDLSNNYYNFSDPHFLASKNLAHLNLEANSLHHNAGWISDFTRDKCHLKSLNLMNNKFYGDISGAFKNLSRCLDHNLESLDLGENEFFGHFPEELVNLRALRVLSLSSNNLSGEIPLSLGQLSSLKEINIYNNFFEGTLVEAHFANLYKLEKLWAESNKLKLRVGYDWLPPFKLKSLLMRSVEIGGQFPQWLQTQKTLVKLDLSNCSITGTLPKWLSSLMNLNVLHLSKNHIEGPIPDLASTMVNLDLSSNTMINGSIPKSLCQMEGLETLDLSKNHLSGFIPDCWEIFESLTAVVLSSNKLTGSIPISIGGDCLLELLQLNNNSLTGELPSSLLNCNSLIVLDVGDNKFSGKLPEWIGNLPHLAAIRLRSNKFHGPIPSTYCQPPHLQIMDLANNKLSRNIPRCFGNFLGMVEGGSARDESELLDVISLMEGVKGMMLEYYITNFLFQYLVNLDLSSNQLVGEIPLELTKLTALAVLNLSHNHLRGTIPRRIGDMNSLESFDVSNNNLFGTIPDSLSELIYLSILNLSNNHLSGSIPTGFELQTLNDLSSYGGNLGLCGDPLLRKCPRKIKNGDDDKGMDKHVKTILGVLSAIVLLSMGMLSFLVLKLKQRKRAEELHKMLTLDGYTGDNGEGGCSDLRIFTYSSIQSATRNFSSDYKLGEGGFGPVYKGKTSEGKDIAVKLLSEESGQGVLEFKTELLLISKLQHVNLVKLIGFCVHGDEKMIIYDYMPHKSLDLFLFSPSGEEQLNWQKRFSIIEGIAQGLLYLHKYSRLKIIHRDLKPSNILLDQNMIPKISDFGIARIFKQDISEANTNRHVGTYGYMAPEYAMHGIFSVKSDVYSFGVLVLEIVSGRKNSSFQEIEGSLSLVEYAWKLWRKHSALELMDPTLKDSCVIVQMQRCIHVGFLCVENQAVDRPTIEDVMLMLKNVNAKLPMPKSPAFITRNK